VLSPKISLMPTLLLSARQTDDAQKLWRACIAEKWDVVRVHGCLGFRLTLFSPLSPVPAIFLPSIFCHFFPTLRSFAAEFCRTLTLSTQPASFIHCYAGNSRHTTCLARCRRPGLD